MTLWLKLFSCQILASQAKFYSRKAQTISKALFNDNFKHPLKYMSTMKNFPNFVLHFFFHGYLCIGFHSCLSFPTLSALCVQIPDSGIRKMILHMIQLEPEARLSAESYLQNYAAVVFPSYFLPFLHNFYCCWNPLHSDMRVRMF